MEKQTQSDELIIKVSPAGNEYTYTGFENHVAATHMQAGETCKLIGIGNSMTPILKSRQPVIATPVTAETVLKKGDIVFCKVKGNHYIHKVYSTRPDGSCLIGNNHGHQNGWTPRTQIFGKIIEIIEE